MRTKALQLETVLRQRLPDPDRRRLSLRTVQGRGPIVWIDRLTPAIVTALGKESAQQHDGDGDGDGVGQREWYTDPVHFSSRLKITGLRTGSGIFTPWTDLASDLATVRDSIRNAEEELLNSLTEQVWKVMPILRSNTEAMDQLDVMLSFAVLASELALVRPQMTAPAAKDKLPELDLRGVRHLVVEGALARNGRAFTPNDMVLTGPVRACVITGPNMGGKSTVLRAVAHAVLLAQAGSYVPAVSARLGVVDGLYARVGARDALWNDQSTFMLEMLETAHFLTHATRHSLVIADEIGRGTAAETGLAIAHATLAHLTHTARARTLFATHFHPIVALLGHPHLLPPSALAPSPTSKPDPTVAFWHTDAQTTPNGIIFDHRLSPGVNTNSYGLDVARLAGVPLQVVEQAKRTLDTLMHPVAGPS